MGGARGGALDRLGLDDPLAVDAQEALGRGAQHRDVAEAQQRGVRRGVARAQGAIGGERVDRAVAVQLGGQADLVALALEDLVLAGGDVGQVGVATLARGERQRGAAAAAAPAAAGGELLELAARWPPARPRRRGALRVGEREQVDAALVVVEGDQPVAEHKRGVGQRRAVHELAAAARP